MPGVSFGIRKVNSFDEVILILSHDMTASLPDNLGKALLKEIFYSQIDFLIVLGSLLES